MESSAPNHYALVVADLRVELSDLEAQSRELEEKTGQLRQAIAFIEERMATMGSGSATKESTTEGGPYAGMSLIESVVEYLRVVGRPTDTRTIADALKKGGYQSKAKDMYNNVYGSLSRESEKSEPRVVKMGTRWSLPSEEDVPDNSSDDDRLHLTILGGADRTQNSDEEKMAGETPT